MRNSNDLQDVETPETTLGTADILGLPVALDELSVLVDEHPLVMRSYKELIDPRVKAKRNKFFVPGHKNPLRGFTVDRSSKQIEDDVDLEIHPLSISNNALIAECRELLCSVRGAWGSDHEWWIQPSGSFQFESNGVQWDIIVRTKKHDEAGGEITVTGKVFSNREPWDLLLAINIPEIGTRYSKGVSITTQIVCRRLISDELEILKSKISIPAVLQAIRDYFEAKQTGQKLEVVKGSRGWDMEVVKGREDTKSAVHGVIGS